MRDGTKEEQVRFELKNTLESLILVHGIALHPDESLHNHPYAIDKFGADYADHVDELISEAFDVLGDEVYKIGLDIQNEALRERNDNE